MISSAARSALRVTSCWDTSCVWRSRACLSISTRTSMALPVSSARQRFLQALRDRLGDEIGDIASERGDLLHAARGEKTVLRRCHQVDGLYVGCELTVELIH